MKSLHLTSQEADELIEYDRAIDNGKSSEYDLDEEHAKVAKEMTNIETHKRKDKTAKPCEDTDKSLLIEAFTNFLENNEDMYISNIEIVNAERELKFCFNDRTYQLTLVQRRK